MPTINTIKPAGGGDYTTAQAWENAVDNTSIGDYIGECYEGGDCGTMVFSSWLGGSTGILRPAAGHEHNGSLTDGAYISSLAANCISISVTSNITVQGMRLTKTTGSSATMAVTSSTAASSGIVIDGNLIVCGRTGAAATVGIGVSGSNYDLEVKIRNNIVVTAASNGTGATGISVTHTQTDPGTKTTTVEISNNTIICNSLGTYGLQVYPQQAINGTAGMNATIKNNIVVGALTACCFYNPFGSTTGTITASNNATSDGTADAWGGSGHVENIVAANTFVNVASDWSLLEASTSYQAGADLSVTFTNDAYGNTRATPWNIGAWGGVFSDPPPVAAFSGTPLSGVAPLTVVFTDESTETPTGWAWDFGDGNESTSQNPSHEFDTPGSYTISLEATNAGGSDSEIKSGYVTVTSPPSLPVQSERIGLQLGVGCGLGKG